MSPISDSYSDIPLLRGNLVGNVTGTLTGGQKASIEVKSADGAITVQPGLVVITKATACVLTLAAPTATTHDGYIMIIVSTTAAAHTVTNSSPGFNNGGAGGDVATFAAAIGNGLVLVAYQGAWYIVNNTGITLS